MTDHKDERQAESEEKNSLLGPRQTPEEIQAEKNRLKRQRKEERRAGPVAVLVGAGPWSGWPSAAVRC